MSNVDLKKKKKILNSVLISKRITEKNLKEEVALILVHQLLSEFIKKEKEELNKNVILENIDIDENELNIVIEDSKETSSRILDETIKICEYIESNCTTLEKMQSIIDKLKEKRNNINLLLMYEPYIFYFNKISIHLNNILNDRKENDNKAWIPDLIAVAFLNHLIIEKGFLFSKNKFIREYNFEKLFSIYNKTDLKIKKYKVKVEPEKENIFRIKTIITEMQDIAQNLAERLVSLKYVS